MFDSSASLGGVSADAWIEIRRRSIVMLPPGTPSGLLREEALELIAELQHSRRQLAALEEERAGSQRRHPTAAARPRRPDGERS